MNGKEGGGISPPMKRAAQVACAILFLLLMPFASSGEGLGENAADEDSLFERFFERGRYEAGFTGGALFSPFVANRNRPTIDYTVTGLQLGYMLGDVKRKGWWRGNLELAAEGFGNAVFEGPGGYIAGATLWLRYNFVPRWSPGLVPYVEAGAGVVSTDIDHHIVGQPFNFNLDLGVGMRYFIARDWALDLECRYQHISNANLGRKNLGINSIGPVLGISYFF